MGLVFVKVQAIRVGGTVEGGSVGKGSGKVDVIVGCAVDKEEVTVQSAGMGNGRSVGVSAGVFGRSAQISLGIGRVVETPVGDGRHGNACMERMVRGGERQQSDKPAEAPSPKGYTVPINPWLQGKLAGGGNDVGGLLCTEAKMSGVPENASAPFSAAGIDGDDDVAVVADKSSLPAGFIESVKGFL
jgi:hypothetical protein